MTVPLHLLDTDTASFIIKGRIVNSGVNDTLRSTSKR